MSPQQPLQGANPLTVSQVSASQASTVRQFVPRGAGLVKGIWTILSARRPVRITIGLFLLLLGIAGLFLPLLQGVATIIAALAILRRDISLAERVWQRWIVPLEQRMQRYIRLWRQRRAGRRQDRT